MRVRGGTASYRVTCKIIAVSMKLAGNTAQVTFTAGKNDFDVRVTQYYDSACEEVPLAFLSWVAEEDK